LSTWAPGAARAHRVRGATEHGRSLDCATAGDAVRTVRSMPSYAMRQHQRVHLAAVGSRDGAGAAGTPR